MRSLLYIPLGLISAFIIAKFWCGQKKKKFVHNTQEGTIYLIDSKIDHLFSVADLISPKADAFDRPHEICKLIREVPPDVPIKIIISTHGGALSHCEKILYQLQKHKSGYHAYIKNECYSAGTIIALGAKEIIMDDNSYLGKIDPQLSIDGEYFSAITYGCLEDHVVDSRIIGKVKESKMTLNQLHDILDKLFSEKDEVKKQVIENMVYSQFPHSKTFNAETCMRFGLPIRSSEIEETKKYFQD
jgi:Serine dehydrogenase proteinase